jgi:hypothetical protein
MNINEINKLRPRRVSLRGGLALSGWQCLVETRVLGGKVLDEEAFARSKVLALAGENHADVGRKREMDARMRPFLNQPAGLGLRRRLAAAVAGAGTGRC